AHPFGNVPAAFSPDGKVGIFESNAIARAVARLAPCDVGLYGRDAYAASRIDGFLDASLVFAREAQVYLLELGGRRVTPAARARPRRSAVRARGVRPGARALPGEARWPRRLSEAPSPSSSARATTSARRSRSASPRAASPLRSGAATPTSSSR